MRENRCVIAIREAAGKGKILGDINELLMQTIPPYPFSQTGMLYKKHADAFSSADKRAVQEFLLLCEMEAELEVLLGQQKAAFSIKPAGAFYKVQGEGAAKALRRHLDYQADEIRPDVFADFRNIGVHLFRRRLESSEISGLYFKHAGAGHCVLVNYEEDLYRQRFSAAHEVAHAIFDSSESATVTFDPRSSRFDRRDLKETRANRFASCYLMPPQLLPKDVLWTAETAVHWAQQFRVSTLALAIALQEANLVDEDNATIIREARLPRQETIGPMAPPNLTASQLARRRALLERGLSDYYAGLCFDAYQQRRISAARLEEALLTDRSDFGEVAALYGREPRHGI